MSLNIPISHFSWRFGCSAAVHRISLPSRDVGNPNMQPTCSTGETRRRAENVKLKKLYYLSCHLNFCIINRKLLILFTQPNRLTRSTILTRELFVNISYNNRINGLVATTQWAKHVASHTTQYVVCMTPTHASPTCYLSSCCVENIAPTDSFMTTSHSISKVMAGGKKEMAVKALLLPVKP